MSSNLAGRTIKNLSPYDKNRKGFCFAQIFSNPIFNLFAKWIFVHATLWHIYGKKSDLMRKLSPQFALTADNGYLPIMSTNKEYLPPLRPCIKCGKMPQRETSRPDGRTHDIYRYACECGNCPLQWSVSESAAIRLWNAYVAN